jgi:hypothetical protein
VKVSQWTLTPHSQYVCVSEKWRIRRDEARSCKTHPLEFNILSSTSRVKSSMCLTDIERRRRFFRLRVTLFLLVYKITYSVHVTQRVRLIFLIYLRKWSLSVLAGRTGGEIFTNSLCCRGLKNPSREFFANVAAIDNKPYYRPPP